MSSIYLEFVNYFIFNGSLSNIASMLLELSLASIKVNFFFMSSGL